MNNSWTTENERVFLLHCLELCSAAFRGPDRETCEGIAGQAVPVLVQNCPAAAGTILKPLTGMQALFPEGAESLCDEIASTHVSLFVNDAGGTPVPPYESCHVGESRKVMGPQAAAMRERLAEAGVEPEGGEPPDHLPLEIEYLYLLLVRCWGEGDEASCPKAAAFASDVMLPWCRTFRDAIAETGHEGFFLLSADLLLAALEEVASLQ